MTKPLDDLPGTELPVVVFLRIGSGQDGESLASNFPKTRCRKLRSVSYLGVDVNVCVESASDIVSVDFAVPVPSEEVFDGCRTDWILALRGVFVSSLPLLILGSVWGSVWGVCL